MRTTRCAAILISLLVVQAVGADRWLLLVRERGLGGCPEYASTVWELDLTGEAIATRRVVLDCSPWHATILADPSTGLLYQQVKGDGKNGYLTRLYQIDYQDWGVDPVWAGHRARLAFEFGKLVVVSAQNERNGPERLIRWDSEESRFVPLPFELSYLCRLEPSGRYHAVRRWGDGPRYGIWDAAAMEFVADENAALIGSWIEDRFSSVAFTPEHSILAVHVVSEPRIQRTFERTRTTGLIYILDLETETYHPQATQVDWYSGSGWSGPTSNRIRFKRDGSLEYRSADGPDHPIGIRRFRLERLGGTPGESEDAPGEADASKNSEFLSYDEVWQFVFAKGVQIEQPVAQSDSVWAFSEHDAQFVLVVQGAGKKSRWFVADLAADTIREFWLDDPLDRNLALDIEWIPKEPTSD